MTNRFFKNLTFTPGGLKHVMSSPHFKKTLDISKLDILPSIHWSFLVFAKNTEGINQVIRGPHYTMSYVFVDELEKHSEARLFEIDGGLLLVYLAPYLNFDEEVEYEFDFNKEIFIYQKILLSEGQIDF